MESKLLASKMSQGKRTQISSSDLTKLIDTVVSHFVCLSVCLFARNKSRNERIFYKIWILQTVTKICRNMLIVFKVERH